MKYIFSKCGDFLRIIAIACAFTIYILWGRNLPVKWYPTIGSFHGNINMGNNQNEIFDSVHAPCLSQSRNHRSEAHRSPRLPLGRPCLMNMLHGVTHYIFFSEHFCFSQGQKVWVIPRKCQSEKRSKWVFWQVYMPPVYPIARRDRSEAHKSNVGLQLDK